MNEAHKIKYGLISANIPHKELYDLCVVLADTVIFLQNKVDAQFKAYHLAINFVKKFEANDCICGEECLHCQAREILNDINND